MVRWRWRSDEAAFPGGWIWENEAFGFLLLLAENYNQTTNDPTTETQSAQRTHRDFLKGIPGSLQLADPGEAVSWPRPALARDRCQSGLRRSSGGLACLAGLGGRRLGGPRPRVHAKARSREAAKSKHWFISASLYWDFLA
jgi:hypothetical protein